MTKEELLSRREIIILLVANDLDNELSEATETIVHSRDSWTKNNSSSKRKHIKHWNQEAKRKSIGLRMEMPVPLNYRETRMTSTSSPPSASRTKVLIHQSKEWSVSADNLGRQQLNDSEETRDEGDEQEEEEENNFISTDDVIESSKGRRRKKMLQEDQEQEKVSQDHSSSSSSLLSSEEGQAVYTMQHVQFMDLVEVLDNHRKSGCFSFARTRATPVIFELKLTIPSTEFVVRKSIEYFPGEYFERIFNLTGNIYI